MTGAIDTVGTDWPKRTESLTHLTGFDLTGQRRLPCQDAAPSTAPKP